MTCEAGVILINAQNAAAEANRLFPLSLGAEGSCTIGGNLSTNAGGTGALAYGVARELVMGLEVVLADGRVLNNLRKLKKDNTGYDLRHIFVGAEGTLGVITAAVLRLFPRPRAVETAFIGLPSPHAALALLNLAYERAGGKRHGLRADPAHRARIRGEARARLPRPARRTNTPGTCCWSCRRRRARACARTIEDILSTGAERGLIEDATIAESLEQTKAFWLLRHHIADTQKYEGGSIKQDVSVPVNAVPGFHRRGDRQGRCDDSRLPAGAVRPSRRRQHPLQRQPAGRRRQGASFCRIGTRSTTRCSTWSPNMPARSPPSTASA